MISGMDTEYSQTWLYSQKNKGYVTDKNKRMSQTQEAMNLLFNNMFKMLGHLTPKLPIASSLHESQIDNCASVPGEVHLSIGIFLIESAFLNDEIEKINTQIWLTKHAYKRQWSKIRNFLSCLDLF